MFLRKKAQSTAEYAIVIGLVVALAAGVLQVALKGGMRKKNKQAVNYLLSAGEDDLLSADGDIDIYSQDRRETNRLSAGYRDTTVLKKGGAQESIQRQSTTSESESYEMMDSLN